MNRLLITIAAIMAVCMAACDDGGETSPVISMTTITPSVTGKFYELPDGYDVVDSARFTIKDIASSVETTYDIDTMSALVIEDGLYDISLIVYASRVIGDNASVQQVLRDVKSGVNISGGQFELSLSPKAVIAGDGFLLAEVCLAPQLAEGVKTDAYSSWFRIVNSSADTLLADGLCIVQTKFATTIKYEYTPDIMADAVAVDAVYRIPDLGLKVAPGGYLLIADQAIDHQEANAMSFDLSAADLEWFDETDKNLDIDNPDVPNLERIFCTSKTVWVPNSQANKGFGLAYISTDTADFVANYMYDYSWTYVANEVEKVMSGSCYMIPNDWIVDFITFSPSDQHVWTLTDPSVDAGYVSIGKTGADKDRLGKAARRKVENGKFVDTNDSSNDFEVAEADPEHVFF